MTGSGKIGLCIALLEEAALQRHVFWLQQDDVT